MRNFKNRNFKKDKCPKKSTKQNFRYEKKSQKKNEKYVRRVLSLLFHPPIYFLPAANGSGPIEPPSPAIACVPIAVGSDIPTEARSFLSRDPKMNWNRMLMMPRAIM